jgi:hypothetical protein
MHIEAEGISMPKNLPTIGIVKVAQLDNHGCITEDN